MVICSLCRGLPGQSGFSEIRAKSYGFEVTAAAVDDFLFWLEFFFSVA